MDAQAFQTLHHKHFNDGGKRIHLLQRPGLVQVDLAAKGIKTNSHESILSMNGLALSVSLRSPAPQGGAERGKPVYK